MNEKHCIYCGKVNSKESNYCIICGMSLKNKNASVTRKRHVYENVTLKYIKRYNLTPEQQTRLKNELSKLDYDIDNFSECISLIVEKIIFDSFERQSIEVTDRKSSIFPQAQHFR